MIGKLWTLLTATACFCTCACREQKEPTQTVIVIDGVTAVRDVVARVSAHVRGRTDQGYEGDYDQAADVAEWPLRLVLAPKHNDASRRFDLELTAADDDGKTLLVAQLDSGFVAGSTRYLSVMLDEACLTHSEDSCATAPCDRFSIAASELGTTSTDTRVFEVMCVPDSRKPPSEVTIMQAGAGGHAGGAGDDEGGSGGSRSAGAGGITTIDRDAGQPGQAGAGGAPECTTDPCGPVDRCAQLPCGDHGVCENAGAGYTCQCDAGYHSTGATCVDDRNCGSNNGGCAELCNSVQGAFQCACEPNAWLKADGVSCGHIGERTALSSTPSTVPSEPQIAFDAAGGGVAIWIQGGTDAAQLYSARFSRSSEKWSKPEAIAGAVAPGLTSPKLLLTAPDTGVVVWLQQGMRKELWFAPYSAGKFGAPKAVPNPGTGNAVWPEIAAGASGDGLLAWTNNLSTRSELWLNGYAGKSGTFGAAFKIDGSETLTAFMARLAFDQVGRANIAWSNAMILMDGTTAQANGTPWVARYDPVVGMPEVTKLDDKLALTPDVAVSPQGLGVTVWQRFTAQPPGSINVVARRFQGTSAIGIDSTLSLTRSQFPSTGPRVGVGANGEAITMWTQLADSERSIWGATSAGPQASWIAATQLNTQPSIVPAWGAAFAQEPALDLAVDPQGDGFGVWSDFTADYARTIWLRRARARARQAKAGFDEPIALETDSAKTRVSHARVAVTPEGKGAVVWDHLNPDARYEVWVRDLR